MRDMKLIAVAVAIIAVLLIGEVYIYTFNTDDTYRISTSVSDGSLSYSIYSGISNQYDIVITNNGDFRPASEFYIYYDESYSFYLNDVDQPIGSVKLDQNYYVSQLKHQLSNRGVETVTVNAAELKERLQTDIAGGTVCKGLVVVSGALPDTIYTGNSSDMIFEWISAGGRLYWAGNLIGSHYSTKSGNVEVDNDYQQLFFGVTDCLNMNGPRKAYNDDVSNDYRNRLSLSSNALGYAIDRTKVADVATFGYSDGNYSSVSIVGYGSGMICIVAGDYSNDQRSDLAQIISSNLCHHSKLIDGRTGNVTRGSVDDTMTIPSSDYVSVYIYLGGYYPVCARCHSYLGDARI